jgi:hypothetical protein
MTLPAAMRVSASARSAAPSTAVVVGDGLAAFVAVCSGAADFGRTVGPVTAGVAGSQDDASLHGVEDRGGGLRTGRRIIVAAARTTATNATSQRSRVRIVFRE